MSRPDPHIIISGGGTGGHIFPAIAIANAIRKKRPETRILFIGAKGRMEMEKVPKAGYEIKALWISGLKRELSIQNLLFPVKVMFSLVKAIGIIRRFKADLAVGVGGYASGPALRAAGWLGIPTVIQEQNSFPGITNKMLAKKAAKICVAYEGMEKYFPAEKLVVTGNPVRREVILTEGKREEAAEFFGLDHALPTVLVIGGSQGSLSINNTIESLLPGLKENGLQLLWQTGLNFRNRAEESCRAAVYDNVKVADFIYRMDLAYALADAVVSRAGAIAIAELSLVGKAVIFIPLPTAAEDHQMKNARRLELQEAAIVIEDKKSKEELPGVLFNMMNDNILRNKLEKNIAAFGIPDADERIANQILGLISS
ncbi:MAG TPA: undecaprenyldiphospho-muramoylpentapeptide beta-N-acetylglucosaminyltransferase [Bacteroidales bacterium]|nr:undecaprenyldiphospho-muramoylpentapeptide beta-N-acetylglucosaminyltransferase [Bacteroidales bacterium]